MDLSNWTTGFCLQAPPCGHWMEDNQMQGPTTSKVQVCVLAAQASGNGRKKQGRRHNPTPLAEFPALRNKMARTIKLERLLALSGNADAVGMDTSIDKDNKMEGVPQFRTSYKMVHTPLVQHFLEMHNCCSQSERLSVSLRLTSDPKRDFEAQKALTKVANSAVHIFHNNQKHSKEYRKLLSQVTTSSNQACKAYDEFKVQWRREEQTEKKKLQVQLGKLDSEFAQLIESGNIQEQSNLLASNLLSSKSTRHQSARN